jgi:hypothetical protein
MEKEEPKQEHCDCKRAYKEALSGICELCWDEKYPTKQETLEEVRKVERSDLYNKIYSIVKQIPREDVETDAMDASSCAYDIEQLFYKWQQERSYSAEEVYHILCEHTAFLFAGGKSTLTEWFEQFKKK